MNVLVTGGSGFLGGRLALALAAEGHEVTRLGRRRPEALIWSPAMKAKDSSEPQDSGSEDPHRTVATQASPDFPYVQVDLRDRQAVHRACRGRDAVFHVAGKAGVWGPWRDYYEANALVTLNVIEACRAGGVRGLIYTSTPSVVFGSEAIRGADETLPYPSRFLTNYARSKALAEQAVLAAHATSLRTASLRPHLIWGPGDPHLLPRLVARARAGRLFQVGNGSNLVSITYVDNAARAHVQAMNELLSEGRCGGKAYFIADPIPVALWTWIRQVLAAIGLTLPKHPIRFDRAHRAGALLEAIYRFLPGRPEPPMTRFIAKQLAYDHYFDLSAAQRDFGYDPQVAPEEGGRWLVQWLKSGKT